MGGWWAAPGSLKDLQKNPLWDNDTLLQKKSREENAT